MTMDELEDRLVLLLEELELPQPFEVMLQGTLETKEYIPEHYFTYWSWDNARKGYYDNKHSKNDIGYTISAYSSDREFLRVMIKKALEVLENNDFIVDNDVTDAYSDVATHTGKEFDVYYILKKEE